MSTSEYRSADAEGELPISEAELSALANQLFATSFRPGPDSPPAVTQAAPRGVAPDVTTATSAGSTAAGAVHPGTPAEFVSVPEVNVPAPTSPGPEGFPPGVAPVAPRGNAADPFGSLEGFAVPAGLVPTAPGVLAAPPSAPVAPNPSPSLRSPQRGSAPTWPGTVPDVPNLGWSGSAPASQDADGFYFLQRPDTNLVGAEPVPAIRDDHEIFDVNAIRADFPILHETVNGKPLIWFDNAATTQKPQAVIDRLAYFYAHENSNIHRAAHELAARATDAYEDAREAVRRFINASKSEQVIFVRGTTEAINLVAYSWGGKHLGPGDEIVITHLEHHANIVPWQLLSQRTGAVLKVAPVDDAGNLLLGEFEKLLGPKTKLVAATQVSNALGTVTPVEKIVELGHRYGARVLIDGAQSIPHIPLDVQALGADFFVFSGHKIFGPTGIGVLYGTEEALEETPPWQGGGNMIADVTLDRAIYQGIPNKFEAGTGNIADAVGLGEALRYVEKVGIERIAAYEHALLEYATPRLAAIPGVRLVGTAEEKASVLSFVLAGHEPLEVGKALNAEGIAVRAGHHCAQPILRRLGLEATVRPSFAFYNTFEEIDVFIDAVRRIAEGSV
ncbi:family 2A encapsulin nanocompartment cargo protein cysteine desulfurase [Mycobacterium sp. C31M]